MSCQVWGSAREIGMRPRRASSRAQPPVAEVRERDDAERARRARISRSTNAGRCVACSVCESTTTSNAPVAELGHAAVDVGLRSPGTPRAIAGVEALAVDLDAAARRSRARRSGARAARRRRSRGRARASRGGTSPATMSRSGLTRPAARAVRVEERGDRAVVLRAPEQERVVAVRRRDLAERDGHAAPRRACARSRASARCRSASRCRTRARGSACRRRAACAHRRGVARTGRSSP